MIGMIHGSMLYLCKPVLGAEYLNEGSMKQKDFAWCGKAEITNACIMQKGV